MVQFTIYWTIHYLLCFCLILPQRQWKITTKTHYYFLYCRKILKYFALIIVGRIPILVFFFFFFSQYASYEVNSPISTLSFCLGSLPVLRLFLLFLSDGSCKVINSSWFSLLLPPPHFFLISQCVFKYSTGKEGLQFSWTWNGVNIPLKHS